MCVFVLSGKCVFCALLKICVHDLSLVESMCFVHGGKCVFCPWWKMCVFCAWWKMCVLCLVENLCLEENVFCACGKSCVLGRKCICLVLGGKCVFCACWHHWQPQLCLFQCHLQPQLMWRLCSLLTELRSGGNHHSDYSTKVIITIMFQAILVSLFYAVWKRNQQHYSSCWQSFKWLNKWP